MAPLEYTLPLCEFERRQLADLQKLLDQSDVEPYREIGSSALLAFDRWKSSSEIHRSFKDFFSDESQEEYQNNKSKAYEGMLQWLASNETLQQNLARTEMFRNANADFIAQVESLGTNDIEVKPALPDSGAWQTIGRLYRECGQRWTRETRRNPRGTFEVWKIIRMFSLEWKWPKNKERVYDLIIENDTFKEFFSVRTLVPEVPEDDSSEPKSDLQSLERLEIIERKSPKAVATVRRNIDITSILAVSSH